MKAAIKLLLFLSAAGQAIAAALRVQDESDIVSDADVTTIKVADGDLTVNSAGDVSIDTSGAVAQLSDLSDVGVTTATDGNYLRADGDSWESATIGIADLPTGSFANVVNSSGVTVAANDTGYLDTSGEYVESTTAGDEQRPVVVVVGGINTATITVQLAGNTTMAVTGRVPGCRCKIPA
jgi:hypothetical protein